MTEKLPRQKFRRLTFVKVTRGERYKQFGKDAIVHGSYAQLNDDQEDDIVSSAPTELYMIYVIEDGVVVEEVGWYGERDLTALKTQDKEKAEKMINQYLGIISDDIE